MFTRPDRFTALFIFGLVGILLAGCAGRTVVERDTLTSLREENQQQAEEITDLNQRIQSLKEKRQELRENNRSAGEKIESLESKLTSLRRERDKLQKQLNAKTRTVQEQENRIQQLTSEQQDRIQSLQQQNEKLESELSQVKQAQTRREGRNVIINLESRILFDLGKYELKPSSKKTLRAIAGVVAKYPNRPIAVEGHTDTVPVRPGADYPTNLHLSAFRAVSVVQFLSGEAGLSRNRLRAVGFGSQQPLKPNNSAENRRLNRRVEIVLYPPELKSKRVDSQK